MSLRPRLWRIAGSAASALRRCDGAGGCLSILIYHSVAPVRDALGHADVSVDEFEMQIDVLASAFNVLPLPEAVRRLRAGTLPARAACITFDDGYADNETVALPMLEQRGLTATFFVAPGYLDGGRMFNDRILEAVRRTTEPALDLEAWALGRLDLATPQARVEAAAWLLPRVKKLAPAAREECTAAIVEASGVMLQPSLMMSREQVARLSLAGMTVGAHTVHHPILNSVPDDEALREMSDSRRMLEEIVGCPVTLFAYPNGCPGRDYSARHAAMAREAGFEAAVSTSPGAADAGSDPYQLPRFRPWDRSPERFLARLLAYRGRRGELAA